MPYNFPLVADVVLKLKKSNIDNLVDRAHYLFTVLLLSVFALFNAGNMLFGSPIQCMAPAEYTDEWISYVNQYCFITSTYVTEGGAFTSKGTTERAIDVGYYQWFAYMLFFQSVLFYVPRFIWSWLQSKADFDLQGVIDRCVEARRQLNPLKQAKEIETQADYLRKVIGRRKRDDSPGDGFGDYATFAYLGTKCLNLVNVLIQLQLINNFVGRGRTDWGFKVVHDAINGVHWDQHGFFPRLSFCKFHRDDFANHVSKEAYCVLMLNMLNEKMFVFLYFWFLVLFAATFIDAAYSVLVYFCEEVRLHVARRYLGTVQNVAPGLLGTGHNKELFIIGVLGRDGLLLLRFIEAHAGMLVASQVGAHLFEQASLAMDGGPPSTFSDDLSTVGTGKKLVLPGDI